MHYKNGKPAKVGDKIVGKDYAGNPFSGIVANTNEDAKTCNLIVFPLLPAQQVAATAGDCLLVDDALGSA